LITAVVDGAGLQNPKAGQWSTFKITPSELIKPDQLELEIFGPSQPTAEMTKRPDGSFNVKWICTEPGEYEIEIYIDNAEVPGSPFAVLVGEDAPQFSNALSVTSAETIYGPGLHGKPVSKSKSSFVIAPRDPLGIPLKYTPSEIFVAFDGPEFVIGSVSPNGDGTMNVTWEHKVPGRYTVNITVGNENTPLFDPLVIDTEGGSSGGTLAPSNSNFDFGDPLGSLVTNLAQMQNRLEQLQEERKALQSGNSSQAPTRDLNAVLNSIKEKEAQLQQLQRSHSLPVQENGIQQKTSSQANLNINSQPNSSPNIQLQSGFVANQRSVTSSTLFNQTNPNTLDIGRKDSMEFKSSKDKAFVKVYFQNETFKTFQVLPNQTVTSLNREIGKKMKVPEKDRDKFVLFSKNNKTMDELDPNADIYKIQATLARSPTHRFIFKKKKKKWFK